jgi:hypothetical protein
MPLRKVEELDKQGVPEQSVVATDTHYLKPPMDRPNQYRNWFKGSLRAVKNEAAGSGLGEAFCLWFAV